MSPLRSSAGPAVWTNGTSSSAATIWASEVLPSPGGPASSTWSSASPRLAAAAIETASWSLSASWPTKSSSRRGPQRAVELDRPGSSSGAWMRAHPSLTAARSAARGRSDPRCCRRRRRRAAPRSRWRCSPGRAAPRGRARRVVAAGDRDRVLGQRRADLLAQLDDDPLGRALADPRNRLEAGRVAGGERREQLARRPAGEHRERDLRARPTGRRAASGTAPAPPRWRTRTGRARRRGPPDGCAARTSWPTRRHLPERLGGDRQPVADAAAVDDHVVGAPDRHRAGDQRDHAGAPATAPPASGARLRSQIATASASAA